WKIFVVIPAYNESKIIKDVLEELKDKKWNMVIVDDGSSDKTFEIAEKSLKNYNGSIYRHSLNRGVGAALNTGIEAALNKKADIIVTFDADGQHDPNDIDKLIEPVIRDDADIVNGTRNYNEMPLFKKISNQIMNILTATFYGIYLKDSQSGFKALSRHAAEVIDIQTRGFGSISEIDGEIKRHNLRLNEVPIKTIYDEYTSKKGTNFVVGLKILFKLIIDLFRRVLS
ncbi:MAG: glycosyltransferase family 2 protein, partial [Methanobacterium sp.]